MRGCARPRAKQVHKPGFRHNRGFGGTATSAIRVFDKPRSNSSANSAGSFDYAYDDYGNQRYRYLSADHTKFWRFTWDGENRLRRAELTLGGQVVRALTFKYDPFGRRIEKKVEGLAPQVPVSLTTTYIYDGEDIVFTTVNDGTATTTTHYVHGPGIDEPLAMVANGQSYYYHADGLGSIVALTDAAKNVVQRYGYDSFGMVTAENPEFANAYTFTGREWDRELGLYYYRARYYDPMEGRFVSRDPIGFAGGDVNLYAYVGNQPVDWMDPWGNAAKPEWRFDKRDHGGPHFQRGAERYNSDTLKPIKHMGVTPPELSKTAQKALQESKAYAEYTKWVKGGRLLGVGGLLPGLPTDLLRCHQAIDNGSSLDDQLRAELMNSGPYVEAGGFIFPNPYYRQGGWQ